MVGLQHVKGGTRLVVVHLVGRHRHHLHEVDVASLVFRQQDQVVATLGRAMLDAVVGYEVGLAAEDGLDDQRRPAGLDRSDLVAGGLPCGHVAFPLGVEAVVTGGLRGVGGGLLELPALLEALDVVLPLVHVLLGIVVLAALEVELGNAEHVTVIREGQGRHLEVDGPPDHSRHARGGIQDREVRVIVKVNEGHGAPCVRRRVGVRAAYGRDAGSGASVYRLLE
jgi:hypothetical protein